jgi:hypothetical protein
VTLRWVQAELTVAMDLYDRCVTGLRLTSANQATSPPGSSAGRFSAA